MQKKPPFDKAPVGKPPFEEMPVGPNGRKKRFAPAGGHGPRGRFMEKPKLKDSKGTILRLLGYLKHVKWHLIIALTALLGSSIAGLSAPKISGNLIDSLLQGDVNALWKCGGLLALAYIVSSAFSWLQQIRLV